MSTFNLKGYQACFQKKRHDFKNGTFTYVRWETSFYGKLTSTDLYMQLRAFQGIYTVEVHGLSTLCDRLTKTLAKICFY